MPAAFPIPEVLNALKTIEATMPGAFVNATYRRKTGQTNVGGVVTVTYQDYAVRGRLGKYQPNQVNSVVLSTDEWFKVEVRYLPNITPGTADRLVIGSKTYSIVNWWPRSMRQVWELQVRG